MSTEASNHFKFTLGSGDVDFDTDSFKVCLMADGFTFDKDADADWADVSSEELATGNGYTRDTKVLANVALAEDDTNDRLNVTADNVTWTASGGAIGPTPGAIVYDDTETDDVVVGYIDFGGDQTQADGGTFTIANPGIRIA